MERWTPFIILMMITLILPLDPGYGAPGTRASEIIFDDIQLSGDPAPSGEYSVGFHDIELVVNNTGIEDAGIILDFYVNITYTSNNSVVHDFIENVIAFIGAGQTFEKTIPRIHFSEGEFNIRINTTHNGSELEINQNFTISDHIDLSPISSNFNENANHIINSVFQPSADVLLIKNVPVWSENLRASLIITSDQQSDSEVYNESVLFMLKGPDPQIVSGHIFSVNFPEWASTTTGEHTATFKIMFNDSDPSNDKMEIKIRIDRGMYLEGWVTEIAMGSISNAAAKLMKGIDLINETVTDIDGYYIMEDIDAGTYQITFTKKWFEPQTLNISIVEGEYTVQNITLTPLDQGDIFGVVKLPSGEPLEGAVVTIEDKNKMTLMSTTNSTGHYFFNDLQSGPYRIWADHERYGGMEEQLTLIEKHLRTRHDLDIEKYLIQVEFDPVSGQENVSSGEFIIATFSLPLNLSTLTSDYIKMREFGSLETMLVYVDLYDSNRSIFIYPWVGLAYDTKYEIILGQNILSVDGIPLGRDIYYTFKTAPYRAEIVISSVFPEYGEEEFPSDGVISITFPVELDPSSINLTTVFLIDSTSREHFVEVNYSVVQRTIYITPTDPMVNGEWYHVYVNSEIRSISTEYFFVGYSWPFKIIEDPSFGSMKGIVLDKDGNPIHRDMIEIRMMKGSMLRKPTISTNGSFIENDLKVGLWTITFSAFGYLDYTTTEVIHEDRTVDVGTIYLYEDKNEQTFTNSFDTQFITGACCVLLMLVIIISLGITNFRLKGEKQKNHKMIDKLEHLLEKNEEE